MSNGRGYLLTAVLCLVFLLSGCTVWKSDKNANRAADQPSTVKMTLFAEPDINPNEKGEPSPTAITVVYLSEDSKLLAADYDQLSNETLEKTLGKNYIDHQEYTLLPNQYKPLPQIKLEENNNYLGVIAYYSDANRTEWKKIIKLNGTGHHYNVLVHLRSGEIELRREEE
ncbi:type VI secretion protein [Chania multitudinisentens RB-25]|uniref:Type VI secretion protein n=1 Tax=Chania multitudinisentens RB-25 TaxID=1441930 RepID=W0L741_9GAMM|nr:type VI secretion system lipoprotein TssJ [Chania multitudinisentens]AHG19551.1 type VI secretion protein [Chania multitudinisentens RB-25]